MTGAVFSSPGPSGVRGKVLVAASGKGGAGKSTTVACLAVAWLTRGKRVALVDVDPNLTLSRWHAKGRELSVATLRSERDENSITGTILELAETHDVVLVDCPGFNAQATVFAVGVADLVLIPSMTDEANVFEAKRTQRLVDSASQMSRRLIPSRALLTRVKRSQVAGHARQQLESLQVPPLTAQMNDRVIFQEASFFGTSPAAMEPESPAAQDIHALVLEVEALLWLTP